MESIRIGNDVEVLWAIYVGDGLNESPYNLSGKDITLYLRTGVNSKIVIDDYTVNGHIISWTFKGKKQTKLGTYTLTLVENEGKDGMHTIDECKFLKLVPESCMATCGCNDDNDNVRITTLKLRTKMSVAYPGNAETSITVDDRLSLTSTNPVQNRVVTEAINANASDIDAIEKTIGNITNDFEELTQKVDSIEKGGFTWTDVS